MNAHTLHTRFRSLLTIFTLALCIAGCRPAGEESEECQTDNDCPTALARCVENVCVECIEAQDCECFEVCVEGNTCEALGASNPNEGPNAHGNWIGSPGNEDYTFVDRCIEDSDCSLGELCNSATGGCVLAADYPESCSSDLDCPRGPAGETLSCDTSRSLCLPAAKCQDNQQCCGRSGVVCSQTQGLCLPLQDECTPTPSDELESTCPLSPQATDECPDGLFCSNDGQCVQCQCDDDCGSPALKCRIYDGTCVAASYCEQDADCDTQEVCKLDVNECVDRCDPNQSDSCPPQSFCDEELLYCRNNSERPCVEDALSPNHEIQSAAPLEFSDDNDFVGDFALCDAQADFFLLSFDEASELQVFISADERLEIVYHLLGSDNQTIVASGFVGELGAELLTTTVAEPSTRILQVIPLNETEGFYSLNIAATPAEACEALGESSSNDTPELATSLWADVLGDSCTQTTLEEQTSFNCTLNSFNLCPGDIDYYTIDVPANSQSRLTVSSSSESIDTTVFGPLTDNQTTLPEVQPTQNEIGLRVFQFSPRDAESYLVRISDPTSRNALYTLNGELSSSGICEEDVFDAELSADPTLSYGVDDAPGLNDDNPTNIFLQPGETSISTNLCLNDRDAFSVRSQDTNEFLPRGQNIQISWTGSTIPLVTLNGQGTTLPTAFVTTENVPLDLEIQSLETSQSGQGNLVIDWQPPEPCSTPASATPSGAVLLEDGSGSTQGSQQLEEPWCGFEDRWFLITQPANTNLEVRASTSLDQIRIEFHDESLRAIEEQTFDSSLTPSRLAVATTTLAPPQLGYLDGTAQSRLVYIRVSNLSGLTDSQLNLTWRLFDDLCLPDPYEDDDRAALATSLNWLEGGRANSGIRSACPGDDDWFEIDLGQSTYLSAQVITPSATNLTFELYDDALNRLSWSESTNEAGTQLFRFEANPMPDSPVFARMRSLLSLSAYRLDLSANNICVDDSLESINPIPLLPDEVASSMKLCNDEDRFSLDTLSAGTWNVCVYFSHDEIDIDIGLATVSGESVAVSATKEDLETITFEAEESQSFELLVFADPRSSGEGTYTAVLQSAPCTSQP